MISTRVALTVAEHIIQQDSKQLMVMSDLHVTRIQLRLHARKDNHVDDACSLMLWALCPLHPRCLSSFHPRASPDDLPSQPDSAQSWRSARKNVSVDETVRVNANSTPAAREFTFFIFDCFTSEAFFGAMILAPFFGPRTSGLCDYRHKYEFEDKSDDDDDDDDDAFRLSVMTDRLVAVAGLDLFTAPCAMFR